MENLRMLIVKEGGDCIIVFSIYCSNLSHNWLISKVTKKIPFVNYTLAIDRKTVNPLLYLLYQNTSAQTFCVFRLWNISDLASQITIQETWESEEGRTKLSKPLKLFRFYNLSPN